VYGDVFDELQELFWMALFFIRWQIMFSAMLGFGGVFLLYIFVRCVQLLLLVIVQKFGFPIQSVVIST